MSPTSDIWTTILLLYSSFCWPYLNFPLIYCPLRMSPRALFVSVMWAPSRNGAVNIQWVHQNPWREIKRRNNLKEGNQALVRKDSNMLCYVCVEPQWSSLHSMRADSDTSQPPFCWNKHHMLSISIQSGSFSRKVWATYKITYFGYIYSLNVNM